MNKTKEIFRRMRSLNINNSKVDMHLHTIWTDGINSPAEMFEKAELNGLKEIAFTDHIRKESDYYQDYLNEIRNILSERIKIFCGFEAKILNEAGEVDVPKKASDDADLVVASVHRIPYQGRFVYPKEIEYKELSEIELKLALALISNRYANVIGHSGGMSISVYGMFPFEYFEQIIMECAKCDVAFEYNYKYHSLYENELKELLIKYNPYVSVGSDAHELDYISKRSFCCE